MLSSFNQTNPPFSKFNEAASSNNSTNLLRRHLLKTMQPSPDGSWAHMTTFNFGENKLNEHSGTGLITPIHPSRN